MGKVPESTFHQYSVHVQQAPKIGSTSSAMREMKIKNNRKCLIPIRIAVIKTIKRKLQILVKK